MKLKLIVKKLELINEKFITRDTLRMYCKELKIDYYTTIGYLTANNYLVTILRGIFYVKSIEERKLNKTEISYIDAISEAMRIKKTKWYFGLESAIKLNNLTHEYFSVETLITDKLSRPKPFKILGVNVKFTKIKKNLLEFGIIEGNGRYSDPEKTILDIIYLSKYNSKNRDMIKNRILTLLDHANKDKLNKYAKNYPKTVRRFIDEL